MHILKRVKTFVIRNMRQSKSKSGIGDLQYTPNAFSAADHTSKFVMDGFTAELSACSPKELLPGNNNRQSLHGKLCPRIQHTHIHVHI